MAKLPNVIYKTQGIEILTLYLEAHSKFEPDSGIYYNIASCKLEIVAVSSLTRDPYFLDEQAAIAAVSAYIGAVLNQLTLRLNALQA